MHVELVEEFKDTRKRSQSVYKKATAELVKNTYLFKDPLSLNIDNIEKKKSKIVVIESDTITTILNNSINKDIKVVALNFADAVEPGGLVLYGAKTQEEQICRCSNLYESLLTQKRDYYAYNEQFKSAIFTDRIIYSSGVTIFKDNNFNEIEPVKTDILTCPSPACPVGDIILCARILGIIKVSAVMEADILILGAWGCGAFHQDAYQMAKCFKYVLTKYNYIPNIIFAIPDSSSYNFIEFYKEFNEINED